MTGVKMTETQIIYRLFHAFGFRPSNQHLNITAQFLRARIKSKEDFLEMIGEPESGDIHILDMWLEMDVIPNGYRLDFKDHI